MSDSDNARDTEAGESAPEDKVSGPKAIPEPSLASRGKPVPRPVRKAPAASGPSRATPIPSKATRDTPVPRPVRPASPAQGTPSATPAEAMPAQAPGTIFESGPITPAGGYQAAAAETMPHSERSIFPNVKKTTSPGTTQAIKTGPGDGGKLLFTRHTIRGEDRVTIRDDIEVVYRFLGPSGPDLYPDTYQGRVVDISLTGAQIEGPLPDDPPRRDLLSGVVLIRAKISLPFVEEPLIVESQVSWVKPAEGEASLIGLRFAGLTQQQTNLVRAFFIGLQSPSRNKFHRGRF